MNAPDKVIMESNPTDNDGRFKQNMEQALTEVAKDPEPCVGCEHRTKCASLRLACDNFVTWVDTGKANARERRPHAQAYLFLFPEDIQGKPATESPSRVTVTQAPIEEPQPEIVPCENVTN